MAKKNAKPNYLVRTQTTIDKEKAIYFCKKDFKKTYIFTTILSIALFVFGIFNLVLALTSTENQILQLVIGGLVTLFSIYPFYSMNKVQKSNIKNSVQNMGIESGSIEIEMQFFEKRIEIITTRNGEVDKKTLMIKNIDSVRKDKCDLFIYLNEGKMYTLSESDILDGTIAKLLSIFKSNQVVVKGK